MLSIETSQAVKVNASIRIKMKPKTDGGTKVRNARSKDLTRYVKVCGRQGDLQYQCVMVERVIRGCKITFTLFNDKTFLDVTCRDN